MADAATTHVIEFDQAGEEARAWQGLFLTSGKVPLEKTL
jgi:hypothetical protein